MLTLVIDCHTRELLGWHLSRSGKATTAASALEHALISRFGTLGKATREFLLRSDNGLVLTGRKYTALVRSYGLRQEFNTPHCPRQNGMVERLIRTLKEQCIHRQRFDMICEANGIEHRLTKPNHPWTNGQVERMPFTVCRQTVAGQRNRTIKDVTVKRFHHKTYDQLRTHLADFLAAYNFAQRLNTLSGLTPCQYICKIWTSEPDRFIPDPIHQMPGLSN